MKQYIERTAENNVRFQAGQTNQNSIEKRFDRIVAGFNKKLGRFSLGDVKQLGRITPNSLTIKFYRTAAGFRKIEFSRQVMGSLSYETGRVVGGFRKANLSRQVSGDINYDMSRTKYDNIKQFGRHVGGTIQCSRVVAGS